MKKTFLLFLAICMSISVMAQLQRSLPVNIKTIPQPVLQLTENPAQMSGTVTQDLGFSVYPILLSSLCWMTWKLLRKLLQVQY